MVTIYGHFMRYMLVQNHYVYNGVTTIRDQEFKSIYHNTKYFIPAIFISLDLEFREIPPNFHC